MPSIQRWPVQEWSQSILSFKWDLYFHQIMLFFLDWSAFQVRLYYRCFYLWLMVRVVSWVSFQVIILLRLDQCLRWSLWSLKISRNDQAWDGADNMYMGVRYLFLQFSFRSLAPLDPLLYSSSKARSRESAMPSLELAGDVRTTHYARCKLNQMTEQLWTLKRWRLMVIVASNALIFFDYCSLSFLWWLSWPNAHVKEIRLVITLDCEVSCLCIERLCRAPCDSLFR